MSRIQIVDIVIERDRKILFIRRSFEPHKDKLDLPGGFIEEGETLEEAAIREFEEETGLKVELLGKLDPINYFERQPKTAHAFIGKIIGGKLQKSKEGTPVWVSIDKVKQKDLSVPHQFIPILKEYARHRDKKRNLSYKQTSP